MKEIKNMGEYSGTQLPLRHLSVHTFPRLLKIQLNRKCSITTEYLPISCKESGWIKIALYRVSFLIISSQHDRL